MSSHTSKRSRPRAPPRRSHRDPDRCLPDHRHLQSAVAATQRTAARQATERLAAPVPGTCCPAISACEADMVRVRNLKRQKPRRMSGSAEHPAKPVRKRSCSNSADCWRRERDSNPRYRFRYTHFPGVRLQPLGHPSGTGRRPTRARRGRWSLAAGGGSVAGAPTSGKAENATECTPRAARGRRPVLDRAAQGLTRCGAAGPRRSPAAPATDWPGR
jgi:hypothetical protein